MVESTQQTLLEDKYITYGDKSCDDFVNEKHSTTYKASIADPAAFWDTEAKRIWWSKPYSKIIDTSHQYLHRWFPDGETNISYNCLDVHVANGDGDKVAFFEDSVYTGVKRKWTYAEVLNRVGRLATVLKDKFGC